MDNVCKCSEKCHMLGTLEQKIMEVLWHSDVPLKPAEVQQKLSSNYKYTTVMTVLKRMYDKNILIREQKLNTFYYYPSKDKKAFASDCLDKLFERLFTDYGSCVVDRFKIIAQKFKINLIFLFYFSSICSILIEILPFDLI